MILGNHTQFKFATLISKVTFGKGDYDSENFLHKLVAKEIAKNTSN